MDILKVSLKIVCIENTITTRMSKYKIVNDIKKETHLHMFISEKL